MNNNDILSKLNEVVDGHLTAKKRLINAVKRGQLRHFEKFLNNNATFNLDPARLLLVGGSGTGKTFIVEELQKIMGFPLLKIDCTDLDLNGREGISAAKLKGKISVFATKLMEEKPETYFSMPGTLSRCVVFLDEIDKICIPFDSTGNWNNQIQASLLSLFEDKKSEYHGVTFIFAGAFASLTKSINKKHGIGFFPGNNHVQEEQAVDMDALIKFGMLPELAGRINSMASLDSLQESDYLNILLNKILPLKNLELAQLSSGKLELSESEAKKAATAANSSNQGVRHLKRFINEMSEDLEFNNAFEYPSFIDPQKG